MLSRNRYKKYDADTVAIETCFSIFILDIFSNFSATKVNLKEPKPLKNFIYAGVSF